MKKMLAFYGSPRRDGNSTKLLKSFLVGVRERNLYDITEIYLRDLNISPCLEIYKCKNDGICAINDKFQEIYSMIDDADSIVLASPVMFYAVSAHTKILMDRCQAFWSRKYFLNIKSKEKKGVFIGVGATKGQKLFDGIIMCVKYFFDAIDTTLVESLLVRGADEKDDILKQPEMLERAKAIGRSLL